MYTKLAAALAVSLIFSGLATAQTPTGSIVGRVTDSSQAGVPGASIRARNVSTNLIRTTESHEDGEYTISNLDPGTYDVTVDKSGFRQVHESGLELQVEQTA